MDNLLSVYREMENSFMKNVYELYKGLQFRTLWNIVDPLEGFQRGMLVSGQLNGVIQLTKALRNIQRLEVKAVKCYTNNIYTTGNQRWTFNNQSHPTVSGKHVPMLFAFFFLVRKVKCNTILLIISIYSLFQIFRDLVNDGTTTFSINSTGSCTSCYNARLLKVLDSAF